MKITRVQSQILRLPADEPLAGGPPSHGPFREFVTLQIETDEGIEGIGFTFFGAALTATLKHAVDQLGALAIGEDPLRVEAVGRKLRNAVAGSGPGILTLAFSAIDMALWDIKGKALNQPLAMLLGGLRDRVATYASGALMRNFPLGHVVKAAALLVDKGFKQMKMQLALPGDTTPEREIERARLIREAIGPDIDLMCDVNQRW
ncbi:MAG: enolase C-terminal domain-like protein, partial [Candidatus Binatia bacterium]